VLAVSGLIEAFVTPSALPTVLRIAIGATCWLGFLGYVFTLGSKAAAEGASADVEEAFREASVPVA